MINGRRVMVVLPAYNAGRTLERTISEIPPGIVDDLLLVDDASGDDTVAVAERLNIPFVVHPENRAMAAIRRPVTPKRFDAAPISSSCFTPIISTRRS